HEAPDAPWGQPSAPCVAEDRAARRRPSRACCRRPVCLERAQRRTSHRHDALLAALAEDAHEARVRVEMLPVEAGELAHAEARGVEQLEDRAIAEAEEPVGPRRREQPVDVVERQVGGQLARGLRRGHDGGRVVREALRVDQEAEEAAHGSELARDRVAVGPSVERAQPVADRLDAHGGGSAGSDEREELAEVCEVSTHRMRRRVPFGAEVGGVGADMVNYLYRGTIVVEDADRFERRWLVTVRRGDGGWRVTNYQEL